VPAATKLLGKLVLAHGAGAGAQYQLFIRKISGVRLGRKL
jgi:hypothetical protein